MRADTDPTVEDDEELGSDPAPARRRRSDRRRGRRPSGPSDDRPVGRRSRARRQRRRRALRRSTGAVLVAMGLALAAILVARYLLSDQPQPLPTAQLDGGATTGEDPQPTMVLATFDAAAPSRGASQVMVLGHDRRTGEATLLFVPATTVADIPGHGLLEVGQAYGFGAGPLLDATLDNLLGLDLDHVVGVSEQGWASLFTRLDGLTIDVPERLDERRDDGTARPRFQPGEQFLDGPRLAELLTFREAGESDLDVLPRAQRVVRALLDRIAADPAVLETVFEDGAPMLDTQAPAEDVRQLLVAVADAAQRDELVVRTLPVSPLGAGEDGAYRSDDARVRELVQERFSHSVPVAATAAGRDVQILNGNGVPGIGQRVAERIVPAGYHVVLTRNADRFDHAETRIIVYDDTPDQLAAAEELRELLGVGRIEHSRTPQSVADITIVVGLDLLEDG